MKALTIRQPYASAVALGQKNVENRAWPTRHRGLLAIHAGSAVDWAAMDDAWIAAGLAPYRPRAAREAWNGSLVLGAVVAVAEITGCHDDQSCHREWGGFCSPWAMGLAWHWELADVRPLAEPVPCKGALGLWNLPDDAERAVTAQLEAVR